MGTLAAGEYYTPARVCGKYDAGRCGEHGGRPCAPTRPMNLDIFYDHSKL